MEHCEECGRELTKEEIDRKSDVCDTLICDDCEAAIIEDIAVSDYYYGEE